MTTTTVIGVTGSFHTMTFHGLLVSTASSVWTSPSVVVRRSGCVEAISPVSQTAAPIESGQPNLCERTREEYVVGQCPDATATTRQPRYPTVHRPLQGSAPSMQRPRRGLLRPRQRGADNPRRPAPDAGRRTRLALHPDAPSSHHGRRRPALALPRGPVGSTSPDRELHRLHHLRDQGPGV